jgi:hypothetical protein
MSVSSMAKALGGKSYELDGRTDKFPKGGSARPLSADSVTITRCGRRGECQNGVDCVTSAHQLSEKEKPPCDSESNHLYINRLI